jgi:RNA-dependent RNA polymerase
VLKADVSEFAVGSLRWKGTFGDKVDDGMGGVVYAKRGKGLTQFVMDTLSNYAQKEKDRQEKLIKERFASKNHSDVVDADLIAPWQKAEEIASRETSEEGIDRKRRDLDAIAEHVRKVHAEWKQRSTSKRGSSRQKGGSAGSSFTTLPIEIRQDTLRALSRKFASISSREDLLFSPPEIARLAASYAYLYDSEQSVWKWSRFPWDVALRDLCLIKAQTLGPWKAVAKGFYDRFQIRASTLAS